MFKSEAFVTRARAGMPVYFLLAGILAGLVTIQALLLFFLGKPNTATLVLIFALALGWAATSRKFAGNLYEIMTQRVGWPTIAVCVLISLSIFLLGGEGRFFYANTDWQVRNAVLLDLVRYPWPYTYANGSSVEILRAPLGMYLFPALAGKLAGFQAAELALLAQNTLSLSMILALGTTLFENNRARWITVVVFFSFSGMDIIGQLLAGRPFWLHLEQWAGLQFTAHLTQAFWVPQHALAGWLFALLYLLWRDHRLPAWIALASVPLSALLSPLAMIGMVPFAAHIATETLLKRQLSWTEILLPGAAGILALPALLYLTAGADSVGSRPNTPDLALYVVFIGLEIGIYIYALALIRDRVRFGRTTGMIVLSTLLIVPLIQVGDSVDFVMRASIPALFILALTVANVIEAPIPTEDKTRKNARRLALIGLAVGLATPSGEIARAILWPRAPKQECGYFGVVPSGYATYVTPVDRLPRPLKPNGTAQIKPHEPAKCWDKPWPDAASGKSG